MDNYQEFKQLEIFNQEKRKVFGQQILGVEKKTEKQIQYNGAPYGLQYGLSSATVSRSTGDDVIPLDDENFQNRENAKLKEREAIVAKLNSIVNNIDARSIMNLPPPSSLKIMSRKRKSYLTQAPSLLQLSKHTKKDTSQYDDFIRTGPRYVDQSLESPSRCVTARRSDLMYRKPIRSVGLETGTYTRPITNNHFDQSWESPFSRVTAPHSDLVYPRPIRSVCFESAAPTRRVSNDSLAFPFSFSNPDPSESKEHGEE